MWRSSQTGIGTRWQALVGATIRGSGRHESFYLTVSSALKLPIDDKPGAHQVTVEEPGFLWEQLHLPGLVAEYGCDPCHSPSSPALW